MGEIIKVVESSDNDVVYGYLVVDGVSREEIQNKIYEIKNDEEFLENHPDWTIDDVFANFPADWDWNYICERDGRNMVEI
jgi:hypothetical protein